MEKNIAVSKISWEDIKKHVPQTTCLSYLDRNDSIDGKEKLIQDCIQKQNFDGFFEYVHDAFWEEEALSENSYKNDVKGELLEEFDDEELVDKAMDEFDDELRDLIRERDNSNIVKDLARTTDFAMFYDTGYNVEPESWCWSEKRVKQEVKAIKKALKIKLSDTTNDKDINQMVRQASYGGNLVVYFRSDITPFMDNESENKTHIKFNNAFIAIINTSNGSGDHCHIERTSFTLPLVWENFFLCKTFKYSYTYEVCGMYSSWCDKTEFELVKKRTTTKKIAVQSQLAAEQQRDLQLTEVFKAGGCTAGDMDITRHRNVVYKNDYPCGHTCPSCKTFWID